MANPDHVLTEDEGKILVEGTTDQHIILESSTTSTHDSASGQYLIFIRRRRR